MATAQLNMNRTTYKKSEVLVVAVEVIMTLCNTHTDYFKRCLSHSKRKQS